MWRRTEEQLMVDRESAVSLSLQGHTHPEIARILTEKRDYSVSTGMVSNDLAKGRQELAERFVERTEMMLSYEIRRVEVLEGVAWKKFREFGSEGEMSEIERVDITGERQEVMRRYLSQKNAGVELGWFNKIIDLQKERRRLLNMYAPTHLTLVHNQKDEVKTKTYIGWTPEAWKSKNVLEGELAD